MISLLPATAHVARAVLAGEEPVGVAHAADWPHADSADALRSLAAYGDAPGTFLVLEDGVVVGDCGWFGPPVDGEAEIGYGLAPSARGRGVGAAAVRLLLEWVAGQGAVAVRACVLPGNEPSLRLLARAGFTPTGEVVDRHSVLRLALG